MTAQSDFSAYKRTDEADVQAQARRLTIVTLTGADERTDIARLVQLAHDHPYLEIGLLYTSTPEGRNRYPSLEWLHKASAALQGRCAIHICGSGARQQLREGALANLVGNAWRVQVNGIVHPDDVLALANRVPILITQHNEKNLTLASTRIAINHRLLVDGSGGTGRSPERWERPKTHLQVGFAGGLGPSNIGAEITKIHAVAKGRYWIDLEGKLRTNDWFDLALCEQFLQELGKTFRKLGQHP
jgi:phosphoribosylanthranilate isomerase